MRTIYRNYMCLLVTVLLVPSSSAAEKITLRLIMKKGDTRKFVFNMNYNIKDQVFGQNMDVKIGIALKVTVDDVDKDGLHAMTYRYDRIKTSMKSGPQNIDFDSDKDKKKLNSTTRMLSEVVGQSITVKMTPQGQLKKLNMDKLTKKNGDIPGGKQKAESMKDKIGEWFVTLPTKPVGIGDSWHAEKKISGLLGAPVTSKVKYTLADRKNGVAIVKIDGTVVSEQKNIGKITGTVRIDEKTGWTNFGNMTMTMTKTLSKSKKKEVNIKVTFGDIELK